MEQKAGVPDFGVEVVDLVVLKVLFLQSLSYHETSTFQATIFQRLLQDCADLNLEEWPGEPVLLAAGCISINGKYLQNTNLQHPKQETITSTKRPSQLSAPNPAWAEAWRVPNQSQPPSPTPLPGSKNTNPKFLFLLFFFFFFLWLFLFLLF